MGWIYNVIFLLHLLKFHHNNFIKKQDGREGVFPPCHKMRGCYLAVIDFDPCKLTD